MKNTIIAIIIFIAAVSLVQKFQNNTEITAWTPPLPETYPLINQLSKIAEKKEYGVIASLKNTGKLMDLIGKNHHDKMLKELLSAVKQFPETTAVQEAALLLFMEDMLQVDFKKSLIQNIQDENITHHGHLSKELQKLLQEHIKDKNTLLQNMKNYAMPLGEHAYIECSAMQCEPPFLRLTQLWQAAYLLNESGKPLEAIEYLQLGIANLDTCEDENTKDQFRHDYHTFLGLLYLQMERYDEAVSELRASEPQHVTLDYIANGWGSDLAFALFEKGYREAALSYWKDALDFWKEQVANTSNKNEKSVYQHAVRFARERYKEMLKKASEAEKNTVELP